MVMRNIKKVIALVLSLAMILTAMPVSAANFSDTKGHWAEASIERWVDAGILNGYADGTFKPNNPIKRGELAKVLSEVLGLTEESTKSFNDINAHWAKSYVLKCAQQSIINGYSDGSFKPDNNVTRQEAVTMIARAMLGILGDSYGEDVSEFKDAEKVQNYAKAAFAKLIAYNVVDGYADGTVKPEGNITRAEVAKLLDCLVGVYVDKDGNVTTTAYVDPETEKVAQAPIVVVNDSYKAKEEVKVKLEKADDGTTVVSVNVPGIEETITVPVDANVQKPVYVQNSKFEEGAIILGANKCENCAVGYVQGTADEEGDYVPAHPHTFEEGTCSCCGMTEDDAMKFYAEIKSVDPAYTGAVEGLVTNDYVAKLTLTPGEVDASKVNVLVRMKDVASLGVDGIKEESKEFSTGLTATPEIGKDSTWTKNMFNFKSGRVNATIVDEAGSASTTYELVGTQSEDGSTVITATPAKGNVEGTRAAWQKMTEGHISTETQETPDSSIVIANGSYMILGNDKLCFEKGLAEDDKDLVLDSFSTEAGVADLEDAIRNKVQLITSDTFVSEEYEAKFYLAAGTKLAVSSSVATLEDNCEITVKGLDADKFATILPDLQASESGSDMVQKLVLLLDEMVGSIDGGNAVNVTMTFSEPEVKDTKFYFGVSAANADGSGTTTVDMEVFDDYSLEINLPMNELNAGKVDLYVMMKDVASMGVSGVKEHALSVETGMTNIDGDLNTWMSNAPLFETATIKANIEGKECTYTLTSDMDADWVTVTGTVDEDAARAAWAELTKHIESGDNTDAAGNAVDNSFVKISKDSYIINGTEKLAFEADAEDLLLDNFAELDALKATIKDSVVLTQDGDGSTTLFIGAGTELAVSSSKATLKDNCMITITGAKLPADALTKLQSASNGDTSALVQELFLLLNSVVGAVDGQTVTVNVDFQ